ncbi:MAG: hypothetical protein K5871_06010 [Lachnospiraceae bacterium]|nr:hypothetical protein [Lachnospiraceae bacterium]
MNNDNGAAENCASFAIMVKGYAGSLGAAKACIRREAVPEGFREDIWQRLLKWARCREKELSSFPASGSIHEALWDIGASGYGFRVNVRDIPLEQEAVEICEALGLNIYEAGSADFETGLYSYPYPEDMILIGYSAKGRDKLLVNGEDVSFLNKPESFDA